MHWSLFLADCHAIHAHAQRHAEQHPLNPWRCMQQGTGGGPQEGQRHGFKHAILAATLAGGVATKACRTNALNAASQLCLLPTEIGHNGIATEAAMHNSSNASRYQ